MKLATAEGDETLPGANVTAPAFTALRDALDRWQRGEAPPISVHDCARVVRLIDQAHVTAQRLAGDLNQHDGRWQGCGDGARIRHFGRRTLRLLRKMIMPTANSASEVVTAALLVIGGKILSGRTKDQNIGYIAAYLATLRVVGDKESAIVDAAKTIGMTDVACFAARTSEVE